MNEKTSLKPSIWGIFTNPTEHLRRVRQFPLIWLPLLFVLVLTLIDAYLLPKQMITGDMTALREIDLPLALITAFLGTLLATTIAAGIYKFIVFLAKGDATFKQLFSGVLLILPINIVGTIIQKLAITLFDLKKDVVVTSLNAVIRLPEEWHAVLSNVDIFTIWSYILTAILFMQVGHMSKKASWITVGIFYLLLIVFTYIGATILITVKQWGA
ncbi:Yip1 family protein [Bacillus sp. NPDC077027]|uniref:Yip1 family protein n=1 Tax=Bacillus sp. NPDC077027 TaxID=3390548 RepID=UPI003D037312